MFPFSLVCLFLKFICVHVRLCFCVESYFTLVEFYLLELSLCNFSLVLG